MPALAGNSGRKPAVSVEPVPVCHAGGRGFESRRSRRKHPAIKVFCCRIWRKRPPAFQPVTRPSRAPISDAGRSRKVLLIAMFCDRGKGPKPSVIPRRSRKRMARSTAGVEEQLERRDLMLTVGLARAGPRPTPRASAVGDVRHLGLITSPSSWRGGSAPPRTSSRARR
jgi:hypothetical protein